MNKSFALSVMAISSLSIIIPQLVFTQTASAYINPGEAKTTVGNGTSYENYAFYDDSTGKVMSDGGSICKKISALNVDPDNIVLRFDKQFYNAEESARLYAVLHYPNTGQTTKHFLCVHLGSNNSKGIMVILKELHPDSQLKNKNWHYYQSMGYVALSSHLKQSQYVYGPNLLINEKSDLVTATLNFQNTEIRVQANTGPAISSVSGGRGETITYNPSLLPSTTTRYVCTNDIDKDYVCDEWESTGGPLQININGNVYNGPACGTGTSDPYCPTASHRDIFVQVDHLAGFNVDPNFASEMKTIFKNKSFYLHLQMSSSDITTVPSNGVTFPNSAGSCTALTCNPVDFDAIKNANFATDISGGMPLATNQDLKSQVFHYVLFGNKVSNDPTTSGVGEVWGNDVLISLGGSGFNPTSKDQQEGTFMHELGHNLNLNHGGSDTVNCKPNYISVMNYVYQFADLVSTRKVDFSGSALGQTTSQKYLPESSLNETLGLVASNPAGLYIAYGVPTNLAPSGYKVASTGGSINWDLSDSIVRSPLKNVDIDYFPNLGCPVLTSQNLNGFQDWSMAALKFNFKSAPSFASGIHVMPDLTKEVTGPDVIAMKHSHTYEPQFYIMNLPNSDFNSDDPISAKLEINKTFNIIHSDINVNKIDDASTKIKVILDQIQSDLVDGSDKNTAVSLTDDLRTSFAKDTNYVKISFDQPWYKVNSGAKVTVYDPYAGTSNSTDTVYVHVLSGSDVNGTTIPLKETGDDTGIFLGKVTFSSGPTTAVPDLSGFDYYLHVSSDDTIDASYGGFDGYVSIANP